MKRHNGLHEQIISISNLECADVIARKGKKNRYGVIQHDKDREANIMSLHIALRDGAYRTSAYTTFSIFEPKERLVFRLPYYPDRIVHHAVMNILEPIFVSMFTADTYSCIKGKGIHGAVRGVKKALRDQDGTKYYLKMDVRKFYPSVNHIILKRLLRRKFKDEALLGLLDEIIDSAPGLPIGNYLSQYLANFYLNGLDHWLKEVKGVKYYFRYLDDIVILGSNKASLHKLREEIRDYLWDNLKLEVKKNYRVAPVDDHGIDFVGYVFRHTHTLMRKTIKKRFARLVAKRPKMASIAAYYGWAVHANANNLLKTLLDDKFFRISNRARKKRVQRRQNKNGTSFERSDNSSRLQNGAFEVHG